MKTKATARTQRGILLLEALVAILLFSIGILAVVGLQANAIKNVTQSKYRSDASFLADQVIGQMWANRAQIAGFAYAGGLPSDLVAPWVTEVNNTLPNTAASPPTVTIITTNFAGPPAYAANAVTVTVFWRTPEELNATPQPPAHSHTVSALIPFP